MEVLEVQAVILAGGEGSRLRPLTNFIPKALLPMDGEAIIDKVLRVFGDCQLDGFTVVLGHLGEKIRRFLGNGSRWGIKIGYAYQERPLGSGDALRRAKNLVQGNFLVAACDTLFLKEEISAMLSAFDPKKLDALVGLRKAPREELSRRSMVKMGLDNFIQEIIEKPRPGEELSDVSAAPIFLFKPKIWLYLESLKISKNGKYELAQAIQNLINQGGKVKGYLLSYSRDITDPKDILRENFPYLKPLL